MPTATSRARAIKNGLCGDCARYALQPGRTRCASCAAKHRERNDAYEARRHRRRHDVGRMSAEQYHAWQLANWCGECLAFKHRPGCRKTGTSATFRRVL